MNLIFAMNLLSSLITPNHFFSGTAPHWQQRDNEGTDLPYKAVGRCFGQTEAGYAECLLMFIAVAFRRFNISYRNLPSVRQGRDVHSILRPGAGLTKRKQAPRHFETRKVSFEIML